MTEHATPIPDRRPTAARSFRPRRRRLSTSLAAALGQHGERYLIGPGMSPVDPSGLFPGIADVVLDVGFGAGEGLLGMLEARPDQAIIGVEVHTPGVARVVAEAAARGCERVRVVHDDVVELLDRLPPGCLAGVRVWYPDPWPKQRQRHRRLLDPQMVGRLVDLLAEGGVLHVATDVVDYADGVVDAAGLDGRLEGGVVERPMWRPVTRFEQRADRDGRRSVDLWFVRRDRSHG